MFAALDYSARRLTAVDIFLRSSHTAKETAIHAMVATKITAHGRWLVAGRIAGNARNSPAIPGPYFFAMMPVAAGMVATSDWLVLLPC